MRAGRFLIIAMLAALAAFLALPSSPGLGAPAYVVDTKDDDPTVAKGACTGTADDCSLRGAITKANAASRPGELITFDPTVFNPGTINIASTLPEAACAATATANDEDPDSLPTDFDDDQDTDVIDVLFFRPHILKSEPDPDYSARFDFDVDGDVDIIDVLFLKSRINTSCAV